jgi:hypothetical protein
LRQRKVAAGCRVCEGTLFTPKIKENRFCHQNARKKIACGMQCGYSFLRGRRCAATRSPTPHGSTYGTPSTLRACPNGATSQHRILRHTPRPEGRRARPSVSQSRSLTHAAKPSQRPATATTSATPRPYLGLLSVRGLRPALHQSMLACYYGYKGNLTCRNTPVLDRQPSSLRSVRRLGHERLRP